MSKKTTPKSIYLTPLSKPEAITVQVMEEDDLAILRFGHYSQENEITYDVNKALTYEMVKDLIANLSKIISKDENEE